MLKPPGNVRPGLRRFNPFRPGFSRKVAISAGLHLLVLLMLIVGIPQPVPPPAPPEDTVAVEFEGPSSAVRKGEHPSKIAAAADSEDTDKEPPAVVKPTDAPKEASDPPPPPPPPAPPPPAPVETKTLDTAKLPPPPPSEAVEALKPPPPAKVPPAPPKPKPEITQIKPTTPPPPEPSKPLDSVTSQPHPSKSATPDTHSFLNTMEKLLAEQPQIKPPTHRYNPSRGGLKGGGGARVGDATSLLTQGEMRQIGAEVRRCYAEDTAAKDYATFAAVITVTIDADGEVRDARLSPADMARAASNPAFRAFAERAEHAVMDPQCAKLPVPETLLGKPSQQLTFQFRP